MWLPEALAAAFAALAAAVAAATAAASLAACAAADVIPWNSDASGTRPENPPVGGAIELVACVRLMRPLVPPAVVQASTTAESRLLKRFFFLSKIFFRFFSVSRRGGRERERAVVPSLLFLLFVSSQVVRCLYLLSGEQLHAGASKGLRRKRGSAGGRESKRAGVEEGGVRFSLLHLLALCAL